MKKILSILFFAFSIFFNSSSIILGGDNDQFVTIVNPVRISYYTKNLSENLKSQYKVISDNNLPATWLLTYDVLNDKGSLKVLKDMDIQQEMGLFLEVSPLLAKQSGVVYHETGSWHHATSVFLSGYTQEERKKLIDTIFEQFKKEFGYYPKSVGSWWSDSYSLDYMRNKYSIVANLTCADQFSTDGYQIWGTPWGIPFYPNKFHSGVPASNKDIKLDIVNIQWAPREPERGYRNSLYSTQDYKVVGYDINFFKRLISTYLESSKNTFGQITIGLESDLSPEVYDGDFRQQVGYAKEISETKGVKILQMSEFASWYSDKFPDLTPEHTISDGNILWYQSSKYRIGIDFNEEKNEAKIFDFRIYNQNLSEPYYVIPNKSFKLSIYIPSVFDEVQNQDYIWKIKANRNDFEFRESEIVIRRNIWTIPLSLKKNPSINIKRFLNETKIEIEDSNSFSPLGYVFKDFSAESIHFFKRKMFIFDLVRGRGWNYFKRVNYFIPQDEITALMKLSEMPNGKVLVYDKECLQCSWYSEFKPPAFSNRRKYVEKMGEKKIIYNKSIFEATQREEAKAELDKLGVKYIYLVKYGDYVEKLPFSPGDLNIEKMYDNANAEIWRIKS